MLNLNKEKRVIAYLPRGSGKTTSIYKSLENGNNLIIDPFMKHGMKPKDIFKQFYPNELDDYFLCEENYIKIKDKSLVIIDTINNSVKNAISLYKIDNLFIDEFAYFGENVLYDFIWGLKYRGYFDRLNKIILLSSYNDAKSHYLGGMKELIGSKQEKYFYEKIIFGVNLPEHLFKL